jgi:succinoglycan biosynthesis transport protein ExoP
MELKSYLEILWRRKWVIAITALMTAGIVAAGTLMMAPSYEAHSTVRLVMAASGTLDYTDYRYTERLLNTYTELATSEPVMDELAEKLGVRMDDYVEVKVIPNTELMDILVENANPELASQAANELAEIIVTQSKELYTSGAKSAHEILGEQLSQIEEELNQARADYESLVLQSPDDSQHIEALARSIELKQETYGTLLQQYETARATEAIRANALSIVEQAKIPEEPSKPNKVLNFALGGMVGLMGGIGLAFLLEYMDTRMHTVAQIEKTTALPVLGRIPYVHKGLNNVFTDGSYPQREAFLHLWTNLHAATRGEMLHMLLVTSAVPGEGKSTIVTNLAVAMAQTGQRVLAVDMDLRRPALHTNFHLPNKIGLSNVLKSEIKLQEAVQETKIAGLSVLTSGPLEGNPTELLCSCQLKELLEETAQRFDLFLLDSPALLPVADTAVMAPLVDGVLLVVARAQTESEAVRSACRELTDIGARMIGLVVTRAKDGSGRGYYKYYRQPAPAPENQD